MNKVEEKKKMERRRRDIAKTKKRLKDIALGIKDDKTISALQTSYIDSSKKLMDVIIELNKKLCFIMDNLNDTSELSERIEKLEKKLKDKTKSK